MTQSEYQTPKDIPKRDERWADVLAWSYVENIAGGGDPVVPVLRVGIELTRGDDRLRRETWFSAFSMQYPNDHHRWVFEDMIEVFDRELDELGEFGEPNMFDDFDYKNQR